ncbi:MAG TPA: MFS transporter, partial [Armatimonadetes bacterium]|nr:MFS transporter [Armatimonadota bacterium]
KMIVYKYSLVGRCFSWTCMMLSIWAFASSTPQLAVVAFLLFFGSFAFMGGIGGIAFLDIIARTIPPRRRGAFWGARTIFGGILSVAAGWGVRKILAAEHVFPFPYNYLLLMALSLVSFTIAFALFTAVNEPPDTFVRPRIRFTDEIRAMMELLATKRIFRTLVLSRVAMDTASIAGPFYATFAIRELSSPDAIMGTFIMLQMVGNLITTPVWSYVSDVRGSFNALRLCLLIAPAVPAIAFSVSLIKVLGGLSAWMISTWFVLYAILGAMMSGPMIAFTNYLMEIAEDEHRSLYMATFNTLDGFVMFFPMLGGIIVHTVGYPMVFGIALLGTLLATWCGRQLRPVAEVIASTS